MLSTGFHYSGPVAVRYPRGTGPGVVPSAELDVLPVGVAQLRHSGTRIALLGFGVCVAPAEQVGVGLV